MVRGKLPLSVHILTFQSEETLPRALGSVSEAREILVIDGGSTDRTVQIAEAAGALVVPQRPKEKQGTQTKDFSGARNVGLKSTSEEWILALDSDEYASEELMTEIRTIIAAGTKCACYIPRRYMLKDGRKVTHATTYPNERIYFFHRDTVKQWIKPVHERVELVRGTQTKHLKGASLAPLGSLQEYRRKNARYLTLEQARWKDATFGEWFVRVFLRTLKSRIIATIRL
ncbi:MAG TPA: glycosyltransferase family 2 protein, partial [Candidatus Peribacteraceae bacterium]|nr:glycosyltransferase family 2 protein [Candidatus Peribacteraceae bacterium]